MWSRFVFELVIWLQEVTLARWTQPSGPLCLWQCFPQRFAPLLHFSTWNDKKSMENLLELWIRTMTSQKIYFWIGTDRSGLDNISSTGFYCCNADHEIVDQILNQQLASAFKYHKNWNSAQKMNWKRLNPNQTNDIKTIYMLDNWIHVGSQHIREGLQKCS